MTAWNAPLLKQLLAHRDRHTVSLHVPGHKSRLAQQGEELSVFREILGLDRTEIPGLDDLHQPEEVIAEAQRLAADCFGAEETWFLVGGSTAGNLAMVMAHCGRGDLLLVQRDAHKSVIHGLMLAGATAVFIDPAICPHSGMRLGVRPQEVEEALARYPEAKGLLLTNPGYYGFARSLEAVAKLLHDRKKLLLVDEAHGGHFGFHPALPPSALAAGADAVVQSTHKMLTAMTMGAMLHAQGGRVNRTGIRTSLGIVQSSSPSYPIMASLDMSRSLLQEEGTALLEQGLQAVRRLDQGIAANPRWKRLTADGLPPDVRLDPFKVTLYDASGALGGFELKAALEARGCYPELADPAYTLLVFSLASTAQDTDRLLEALRQIDLADLQGTNAANRAASARAPIAANRRFAFAEPRISAPVAFELQTAAVDKAAIELVAAEESAGRIAAEMIVPYPPGIPYLYRGERIDKETAASLGELIAAGSRFHGYDAGKSGVIPVLARS